MKANTALRLIPKPLSAPYDDTKGLKAIARIRANLIDAALKYIVSGREGTVQDRIRTASNLSGITRDALCVAVKSQG